MTIKPDNSLDTTIEDLHRIRREIATAFRNDPFAITADAQARAEASGRTILRRATSASTEQKPIDASSQ